MDKLTYAQSLIDQGLDKETFILEMDKFDTQNVDVECGEGFEKDENNNCVPVGKQNPAVSAVETVDVENTVETPNGALVSENTLSVSIDGDPLKTNKGFTYTETEKPWEGNSFQENLTKITKDQGLNENFFKDQTNIDRFVKILEKEYADASAEQSDLDKELNTGVNSIKAWAKEGDDFVNGYNLKDINSGPQSKFNENGDITDVYLTYVRTHKDSYNLSPELLKKEGFLDEDGRYTMNAYRAGLGKEGDKLNYEYWLNKAQRNTDGELFKTPINYKLDDNGNIINSDFDKPLTENTYVDQFGNPFNINPNIGEFLPTNVLNINEETGEVTNVPNPELVSENMVLKEREENFKNAALEQIPGDVKSEDYQVLGYMYRPTTIDQNVMGEITGVENALQREKSLAIANEKNTAVINDLKSQYDAFDIQKITIKKAIKGLAEQIKNPDSDKTLSALIKQKKELTQQQNKIADEMAEVQKSMGRTEYQRSNLSITYEMEENPETGKLELVKREVPLGEYVPVLGYIGDERKSVYAQEYSGEREYEAGTGSGFDPLSNAIYEMYVDGERMPYDYGTETRFIEYGKPFSIRGYKITQDLLDRDKTYTDEEQYSLQELEISSSGLPEDQEFSPIVNDAQLNIYKNQLNYLNDNAKRTDNGMFTIKGPDKIFEKDGSVDIIDGRQVLNKILEAGTLFAEDQEGLGASGEKLERATAEYMTKMLAPYGMYVTVNDGGYQFYFGSPEEVLAFSGTETGNSAAGYETSSGILKRMYALSDNDLDKESGYFYPDEGTMVRNQVNTINIPFSEIDKDNPNSMTAVIDKINSAANNSGKDFMLDLSYLDASRNFSMDNIMANQKVVDVMFENFTEGNEDLKVLSAAVKAKQEDISKGVEKVNEINNLESTLKSDEVLQRLPETLKALESKYTAIISRQDEINERVVQLDDNEEGRAEYEKLVKEFDVNNEQLTKLNKEANELKSYEENALQPYNEKVDEWNTNYKDKYESDIASVNKLIEDAGEDLDKLVGMNHVMLRKLNSEIAVGIENNLKWSQSAVNKGRGSAYGYVYNQLVKSITTVANGAYGMVMDLSGFIGENASNLVGYTGTNVTRELVDLITSDDWLNKEALDAAEEGSLAYIYKNNKQFRDGIQRLKDKKRGDIDNFMKRYIEVDVSDSWTRNYEQQNPFMSQVYKVMIDMGVDIPLMALTGGTAGLLKAGKYAKYAAQLSPMFARTYEMADDEIDLWKAQNPGKEFPMSLNQQLGLKLLLSASTAALERAGFENMMSGGFNKAIARRIAMRNAGIKGVKKLTPEAMDKLVKIELDLLKKEGANLTRFKQFASGVAGEIVTETTQSGTEWGLKELANNFMTSDGQYYEAWAVPEFNSMEMREDLWNTVKVTAAATIVPALFGAGGRNYKAGSLEKMDAEQLANIQLLSDNQMMMNLTLKNIKLKGKEDGLTKEQIDEKINNIQQIVALSKSLNGNGVGTEGNALILPTLQKIKALENQMQKESNNKVNAKIQAEINLLQENIESVALDPYYSEESEANRLVDNAIQESSNVWNDVEVMTDEDASAQMSITMQETENTISALESELNTEGTTDARKIEIQNEIQQENELAENTVNNLSTQAMNTIVVENAEQRQQVMEDYGLTEEDMTGVEIDPETGQKIYKNAYHDKDQNLMVVDKEVILESGRYDAIKHEGKHQFLRGLLAKFKGTNAVLGIEKLLRDELDKVDSKWETQSELGARWNLYKERPAEVKSEELITLLSDAMSDPRSGVFQNYKQSWSQKLLGGFRRLAQNLGADIKVQDADSVLTMIRDFNKSYEKGSFTNAQKRFLKEGGEVSDAIIKAGNVEAKNIIKPTKEEKKYKNSKNFSKSNLDQVSTKFGYDLNKPSGRRRFADRLITYDKDGNFVGGNLQRSLLGEEIGGMLEDITKITYDKQVTDRLRIDEETGRRVEALMSRAEYKDALLGLANNLLAEELRPEDLGINRRTGQKQTVDDFLSNRLYLRSYAFPSELGLTDTKIEPVEETESSTPKEELESLIRSIGLDEESNLYKEILSEVETILKTDLGDVTEFEFRERILDQFRKRLFDKIKKEIGTAASPKYKAFLENGSPVYEKLNQRIINKRFSDFKVPLINPETGEQYRMTVGLSIDPDSRAKDPKGGNKIFGRESWDQQKWVDYHLKPKKGRPSSKQNSLIEALADELGSDAVFTALKNEKVQEIIKFRYEKADQELIDKEITTLEQAGAIISPIDYAVGDVISAYSSGLATQVLRNQNYRFSKSLKKQDFASQQVVSALLLDPDFLQLAENSRVNGDKNWFANTFNGYIDNKEKNKIGIPPNIWKTIGNQLQVEFDKLTKPFGKIGWQPYLSKTIDNMLAESDAGVYSSLSSIAAAHGYNIETGKSSLDSIEKVNKARKEIVDFLRKGNYTDQEIELFVVNSLAGPAGLAIFELVDKNNTNVVLTPDQVQERDGGFRPGLFGSMEEIRSILGYESADVEKIASKIHAHKNWFGEFSRADKLKYGAESFENLSDKSKIKYIKEEIQPRGLEAKALLDRIADDMAVAFDNGDISVQTVATFTEIQFASMKGLGKLASDVRFIPTMSRQEVIDAFGVPENDKYVLEHTIPATRIKTLMFNYIISPKSNKNQARELFKDDLEQYHSAIIPEYFDKRVNYSNPGFPDSKTLFLDTSPGIREAGDFPLGETGRYSTILPIPMVDVDTNVIYGTPEALVEGEENAKKEINDPLVKESKVMLSQSFSNEEVLNKARAVDEALRIANQYNAPVRKIRVFDFDDTLARTNSNVLYTMPDGTTGKLTAEEFAKDGDKMLADGAVWDFSEFNKVVDGKPGPLLEIAKKIQAARGAEDVFVLTARAPESQGAIFDFLQTLGLNIPLSNITGLGNSSPLAKSNWIVNKAAEGYNDFYFADDHTGNVKAVQDVLDVIDVKGKVQQAKVNHSKSINQEFNQIIQDKSGIEWYKEFSEAKAKRIGGKKWNPKIMAYSAQDFEGLIYQMLGKGKQGDAHKQWFKENLFDPFSKAMTSLEADRSAMLNDFKALKKQLKAPKKLSKKIFNKSIYTNQDAVRVWIWNSQGVDVPGLSKADLKALLEQVENDQELMDFAKGIIEIQKGDQYALPSESWYAGTITTDILDSLNTTKREKYLADWQQNVDIIFSKENMNKLEALYGPKYIEALKNILARMKSGKNRLASGNRLANKVLDYINGSVGTIMFLNMRSAVLQTLSTVNFINWNFNNPAKAGIAFANQPQYWKDFMSLMNSDYLTDRRNGLKLNVTENEIADTAKTAKNKGKAVINYLLKIGYTPTQVMDSFAIASGGATFYRNRIKDLMKNNPEMSEQEAESIAYQEFKEISETSQQSSRPDKISSQQASDLGRLFLAFANTPMQYNRIILKAVSDLSNQRGDWKSNVSKIAYYGFIQNMIFNVLQQGVFALMGGDGDDEMEEEKITKSLNGMLDSFLRGLGIGGQTVMVLKNLLADVYDRSQRPRPEYSDAWMKLLDMSPPIKSKVSKLKQAGWQFDSKKKRAEVFEGGFGLDNPGYLAFARVISATVNIPLDRLLLKLENISGALDEDTDTWMRIAMLMGWPKWQLESKGSASKEEEKEILKAPKIKGSLKIPKKAKTKDGKLPKAPRLKNRLKIPS